METTGATGEYCVLHDWSSTAPSIAIIDALATIENVEPAALAETLDTTLYDHVDPDALDRLVADDSGSTITFPFTEYLIRIQGETVVVTER